jgi:CubicO group peptidase (beta-lactamase class C family)
MKRARWLAAAVLVVAVAALLVAGGAHPLRTFTGMVTGAESLAYLPPRREVRLEPGPPQPTLSLAEAGIDARAIELAAEYAAKRNTRALVVGFNGHVVYEKYWDDTSLDREVDLSGFTPVLSALVLGTALQNGELRDLDAPLSRFLGEWESDPRGTITLRELVTGDSHLAPPGDRTWPRSLAARYHAGDDLHAGLLAWPLADEPDPEGSPADVDADLLALALSRALKADYPTLLRERLWLPMGAGSFSLGVDDEGPHGHARAGCCLRARLSDWMRIGALIANHGIFEGNQFAPPDYARLLVTPTHPRSARAVFMRVDGQFAARDVVRLEAEGKQRLWMVPSLKLVILRVGSEPAADQGWDEAMIPDSIIRNIAGWQPGAAGEGVDPNKFAPH